MNILFKGLIINVPCTKMNEVMNMIHVCELRNSKACYDVNNATLVVKGRRTKINIFRNYLDRENIYYQKL